MYVFLLIRLVGHKNLVFSSGFAFAAWDPISIPSKFPDVTFLLDANRVLLSQGLMGIDPMLRKGTYNAPSTVKHPFQIMGWRHLIIFFVN